MRRLKFFLTVFLLISLWGQAQAQNRVRITGTVTSSEDNQPLVGAAVIDSAGNGVITDLDGHYEIIADSASKLVFSCFGFLDVEKTVPDMDPCILDVALETETLKLEDAVVIAYGVRRKGTVTGSVSTVKADKLENTPVPAFDQALQGQVAGLSVLSSTGEPSASATMVIRGTNSINSGTAPL